MEFNLGLPKMPHAGGQNLRLLISLPKRWRDFFWYFHGNFYFKEYKQMQRTVIIIKKII